MRVKYSLPCVLWIPRYAPALLLYFWVCVCGVLGLQLRAYALSHSTSPFLWRVFSRYGLANYLPRWASNLDHPDLCLLSNLDYRHEPPALGVMTLFLHKGTTYSQACIFKKFVQKWLIISNDLSSSLSVLLYFILWSHLSPGLVSNS
jgi:hypothetical protein